MPSFDITVKPFETEENPQIEAFAIVRKRSCQDVVFLFLLLAVIGGMCYTSYLSLSHGDPHTLAFGVDSWGNVCNKKNSKIDGVEMSGRDTRGESKLFFFDESVLNNYVIGKPTTTQKRRICVSSCPSIEIKTYEQLYNISRVTGIEYCMYDYEIKGNSSDSSHCPDLPISIQKSILFRCVPSTLSTAYDFIIGFIDNVLNIFDENFTQKCLSDLEKTWKDVCYLIAVGFGVSLILVHLMRFIAGFIIWLAMFLLGIGSMVATGLCWYHYSQRQSQDGETKNRWLTASICVTVVMVIILLILLIMRKRIALVVQLFKEAGKALGDMPLLIFQPLLTLFCILVVLIVMLFFFSFTITSEHPIVNPSTGFVSYETDNILKHLKWFYIFGSIWILQFMLACETIVIAGALSMWFFSRKKSTLRYPVCDALKTLIRYHLGSAAFGSLLIALLYMVRLAFLFISNRLKGKSGPVVDFILKCCCCCLWCFHKLLKFINSNAYIEIAISGNGFCTSAKRAFRIVVGNALRLAAINSVGNFTLFLGKLTPVSIVAVVGMELMTRRTGIFYPWFPVTISCLFTYLIALCFLGIYEKCIDILFICFCEDCEMNDGEQRPYFMSAGLMKFVSNANK